ncbi:MAG TPA: hypothetical protein VF324_10215 [Methanobacterium sp.]
MKMEDENITGDQVLELIRDKRKSFHGRARFPNAILIHPGYYSLLKKVINTESSSLTKKVFDLEIFETDDVPSFQLIRIYESHECSI